MGNEPQSSPGQWLTATHWSELQAARTATPDRRRSVLENLAQRYWSPVYHFLRAQGRSDAEACDLTQDFFVEVILGRDLFRRADPQRGRFRTYLSSCLKTFLHECHRRQGARRRSPKRLLSINEWADSRPGDFKPRACNMSPEDAFHHQWAAALLARVIARLADACHQANLDVHFTIFQARVVRPTLAEMPPTPLEALAGRFGLTTKQVANRCETVRRRFRALLFDEVQMTVSDHQEVDEELRSLMEALRHRST